MLVEMHRDTCPARRMNDRHRGCRHNARSDGSSRRAAFSRDQSTGVHPTVHQRLRWPPRDEQRADCPIPPRAGGGWREVTETYEKKKLLSSPQRPNAVRPHDGSSEGAGIALDEAARLSDAFRSAAASRIAAAVVVELANAAPPPPPRPMELAAGMSLCNRCSSAARSTPRSARVASGGPSTRDG